MQLPTIRCVAIALILTLLALGPALAEDATRLATLTFIDKPWAMRLDVTGFPVHLDGVRPDGRRYLLATDDARSIDLSVPLELVHGPATEQGCLFHLKQVAQTTMPAWDQGPNRDGSPNRTLLEYVLHAEGQAPAEPLHLLACTGKDDVYTDSHLSQPRGKGGDTAALRALLHSLTLVAAPAPSSLDHCRAGSAPYLLGKFALAIPHSEQALILEEANPTLDRPLWQLLIHNLGTADGRTGRFGPAKATFDYPALFMTVRREIAESRREVRGSTNKSSHACGRRRGGEPAVSWRAEPGGSEAYSCSTLRIRGASPPAEGSSQQ